MSASPASSLVGVYEVRGSQYIDGSSYDGDGGDYRPWSRYVFFDGPTVCAEECIKAHVPSATAVRAVDAIPSVDPGLVAYQSLIRMIQDVRSSGQKVDDPAPYNAPTMVTTIRERDDRSTVTDLDGKTIPCLTLQQIRVEDCSASTVRYDPRLLPQVEARKCATLVLQAAHRRHSARLAACDEATRVASESTRDLAITQARFASIVNS